MSIPYSFYLDEREIISPLLVTDATDIAIANRHGTDLDYLLDSICDAFRAAGLYSVVPLHTHLGFVKEHFQSYSIAGGLTIYPRLTSLLTGESGRLYAFMVAWVFQKWRLAFGWTPRSIAKCINEPQLRSALAQAPHVVHWSRLDAVLFVHHDAWLQRVAEQCEKFGLTIRLSEYDKDAKHVPIYVHPLVVEGVKFWRVSVSMVGSCVATFLATPLSRHLVSVLAMSPAAGGGTWDLARRTYTLADGSLLKLNALAETFGCSEKLLRAWQELHDRDPQGACAMAQLLKI